MKHRRRIKTADGHKFIMSSKHVNVKITRLKNPKTIK